MIIYIKSMLVGAVALVISEIVYIVILASALMRRYQPPPGAEIGLDLGALLFRPSSWLIALLAFVLGFYWEFRRAAS